MKTPAPRGIFAAAMEGIGIKDNRLVASGTLGYAEFTAFERCCRDCLTETQGELLVDLSGVEHMTSAYLGALLELVHSLAERGRGMKVDPSPVVRQIMQLTGIVDAIPTV